MRRIIITFIIFILFTSLIPGPVHASSSVSTPTPDPSIQFGETEIINDLPEGYAFEITVTSPDFIPVRGNITLYFTDDWTFPSNLAIDPAHPRQLSYYLNALSQDIYPFTPFQVEWTVTDAQGRTATSGKQTIAGYDPRYKWKVLKSDDRDLTIYCHDRKSSFREMLVDVTERSANFMEEDFDLHLSGPITVVIYNDQDEVLDYYTYFDEKTGGVAVTDLGLTIQVIEVYPGVDDWVVEDWVNEVIPHEISHLYYHQAIDGQAAPNWINEGLAQVNEFSLDTDYLADVNNYLQDLQPLPDLRRLESNFDSGQWSSTDYMMAYSITSYIIYTYGKESIHAILSKYATGTGREKAFKDVLGVDFETLYSNWLERSILSGDPAYYLEVTPMGIPDSADSPTAMPAPNQTATVTPTTMDKGEFVKGAFYGLATLGLCCFLLIVLIIILLLVFNQQKKKQASDRLSEPFS